MKISFDKPGRRWLIVATAGVLSLAYVALAATQLAAFLFAGRAELTSLKRATRLDPGNAEYFNRLGRYYDLAVRDPLSAVGQYRAAAQLEPHSARYWFDLSSTYQILGDTTSQTAALERALQADAMTPDVAWEAANFYLVQGENEKALHEFQVVIANEPSLEDAAIQFCWRIEPDVDALLQDVIPARSDAYASLLALLESKQDSVGAAKVWTRLIGAPQPFEARNAYDYIRYAVQHKEVDQAVQAWRQTAIRFGYTSYLPSSSNLVVNGGFNLSVLNAGFDWQYQRQQGVTLNLDPTSPHSGRRSLEITFDGPGINDAGIYELVAVQPNTAYDFSAYFKSGEMEGAGGAHFTIQDMYTQTIYYESDELKEAGFWKSADGSFTTGPDCQLVVLHMRRLPAGSPIRGKLWVDDFHLTRKPS